MRVAILRYEGIVNSSVVGPYDMLTQLGPILHALTGEPVQHFFDVDILEPEQVEGAGDYDLLIIGAMDFLHIPVFLESAGVYIPWIKKQYRRGAEVASICLGAFLLAATGLLDGKRATTHWLAADLFRQTFPAVDLQDDKIIIDEGRIYTCGGALSYTSLIIYLIEKYCGRETALMASKAFMVNVHSDEQRTFSIFQLQHRHGDEPVSQAQQRIEQYYSEKLSVEELAARHHMSMRNFMRRFTAATGNTPLQYLQRVRTEAAKKMLENASESVEQVALQCGYDDTSFFRKIFRRHTGTGPKEYREKYGRMLRGKMIGRPPLREEPALS